MEQFELNFEAGLTQRFNTFGEIVKATAYGCSKPFKNVAADMDLSSSALGRMLNETDPTVNFPAHRLPELIEATDDLRPIFWLVEKYCQDSESKRKASLDRLAMLLPEITHLLKSAAGR